MEVQELNRLAAWYVGHFSRFTGLYQNLINSIQHNANQANKTPLEPHLGDLLKYLNGMDMSVLSIQQINLLEELGVAQWIGREGARNVEAIVKTSDYDPATAVSQLNAGFGPLSNFHAHFTAYINAVSQLQMNNPEEYESEKGRVTVRVGFQKEAKISNMTELKAESQDWYDIIYGLSLANNEAPEETKITGATKGSIILILAATVGVTKMLAVISGHVSKVAMHGLTVLHSIEDLQKKKLLNAAIEEQLMSQVQKNKEEALDQILTELKPALPDASGDKIPALTRSIKKLLEFNEKGGNVDFVEPDEKDAPEGDGATVDGQARPFEAVRAAIRDYQEIRESIRLLTDGTDGAGA